MGRAREIRHQRRQSSRIVRTAPQQRKHTRAHLLSHRLSLLLPRPQPLLPRCPLLLLLSRCLLPPLRSHRPPCAPLKRTSQCRLLLLAVPIRTLPTLTLTANITVALALTLALALAREHGCVQEATDEFLRVRMRARLESSERVADRARVG